ncbi:MAG TPA: hypothetical protein VES95_03660 [Dermatophilaceae bacterium]|nr:hypothetical protein [Dermatophilaceae bacterium]
MPRTAGGALTLAEEQPLSSRRRWAVRAAVAGVAVAVGAGGWAAASHLLGGLAAPVCRATALGESVELDPGQMGHAATITAIAMQRGLPARAATIALATAIQESKLRNLRYGDRDSLGLFQQRPSQGWGTAEQVLDPEHATNAFYDALVKIDGYEDMEITEVAQEVQRSAYPQAYADHEQEGRILASALAGHSPGGLGCRLRDPETPADGAAVAAALKADYGIAGTVSADTVTVRAPSERLAWSVGAWATAKAGGSGALAVTVEQNRWRRTMEESGLTWAAAGGAAAGARTVVITLR